MHRNKKNIFINFKSIFYLIIISVFLVIPNIVLAVAAAPPNIKLQIPILGFTDAADIAVYIKAVYKAATYIVVPIVILVIMLGGIEWLTAAGRDPEGMNNAKSRIWHGLIGLGIVLLSYVLLSFVGITELKPPEVEYIGPLEDGGEAVDYPGFSQGNFTFQNFQDNLAEKENLIKSRLTLKIKEANAAADMQTVYKKIDRTCMNDTFGAAKSTKDCEAEKSLTPWTCENLTTYPIQIHQKVLPILQKVCNELKKNNIKHSKIITQETDQGGFGCRMNKNAKTIPSMHSYGIALDLDPWFNPNCTAGSEKCVPGESRKCTGLNKNKYMAAKSKYGNKGELCPHALEEFGCPCNLEPKLIDAFINMGFRWGAYDNLLDGMHFEWFGTCAS